MPGTGLPLPKNDNVRTEVTPLIPGSVGSTAALWQTVAQSGERLASEAGGYLNREVHAAQVAQIANFEVDWRAKRIEARDKFTNDPEGFKNWATSTTEGAVAEVPGWMVPHAKQFLSREFEGAYASILGERRAQDEHLDTQALVARTKMADDDVMSIANATGGLNSPEAKAALVTYDGVLKSAVGAGLMAPDHAQLLTEDLTTRAQGTIIRKSVEQVYREKGYEAARAHLDDTLQQFGAKLSVTDKLRTQTLGWLRSEEAGLKGEREAIGREWTEAKKNIAVLSPDVLADIQNRAYAVGNMRVGDDIQTHVAALNLARVQRQLPEADQIRFVATGNIDSRLVQRESSGDPTKVNKFGYTGVYQFGAPRLADLKVYTPGSGENLAAWSKTPSNAPGKWTGTFNIPGFPDVKTVEDFRKNPDAQKAVYGLHQQRTEEEIDRLGLGSFVGQTVGGVPITRDGIRAMVHLAGAEGALQTLSSGGRYNPADANGTTALDYARMGVPGDITGSRAGQVALGIIRKDLQQGLGKQITDMQSHINMTEFPPMEEIGELGAKVHLLGTEEQKRQVAEMAAQAEHGKKFAQMPKAQRDELIGRWNERLKTGAPDYERRLVDVVRKTDAKVNEEFRKDPYGASYRFSEGIQALPAVDWGSPTLPNLLAAKVAQQNMIRADQGIGAFSALRPGESEALGNQLVNGDPRASKAIMQTLAGALPADIYKATITEGPIKAALDGMVRSYDPAKLDLAMSTLDRAWREDPIGTKQAFGDATVSRLQDWLARKDYLQPIEMAEYFKRADDPSFATARKQLREEAANKAKDMTPAKVANELGSVADRWVPFVNQAPPVDALAGAALLAEYNQLYEDRYVGTGDVDKAKAQTVERLKTVWGPSTANGGALMRHPPERYYPQVDGSHDWMKRDVEVAIVAARGGEADSPDRPAVLFGKGFTYKVVSDARTDADVSAKRPPSYVVIVTDSTGRPTIPLDWSGNPMRFSFDPKNAQERARERFTTNRASPDPFSGPVGPLGF